ncbi:MAG: FAD-binding protein [Bryobacterales bacterium]|nr:FAD-binding protein [Bryobacterales bacterium]
MVIALLLAGCAPSRPREGGASVEYSAGQNWAKTFSYAATKVAEPRTVAELQAVIQESERLKPLGSRHSFSKVADTEGTLVSMQHFAEIGDVDAAAMTVTVGGGVKYGDLCERLDAQGYALHNLASLPHISIAGAISTGTHGSGSGNGNLATAVEAMELVTPSGEVRRLSRQQQGEQFDGMVVGLGTLGFVTKVTLQVQPRFEMRQYVYEDLPVSSLEQSLDAVMDAAYSVSLFTTWGQGGIEEVWVKTRTGAGQPFAAPSTFHGAKAATKNLHPIRELSPEHCTPQMGIPGPWYERLPHFKMGFTPSSGEELQSEFFVARKDALPAMRAIFALHDKVAPVLQISEVRAIKGDNFWLSPAFGRDSIAIHFTWKKDEAGVLAVLPLVEAALKPYGARPHWGKVFTMAPGELQQQYPKLESFRALMREFDPAGKLRNRFSEAYLNP